MIKFSIKFILIFFLITFLKCLLVTGSNIDEIPKTIDNGETDSTCPDDIECVPKIQCQMPKVTKKLKNCTLITPDDGFCCLTVKNQTDFIRQKRSSFPQMQNSFVEEARSKFADILQRTSPVVGSPKQNDIHQMMFQSPHGDNMKAMESSKTAMEQIYASQIYRERQRIPVEDFRIGNVRADFSRSSLANKCPGPINCPNIHSKYRTYDGYCNNPLPDRAMWGAAGQPMERLLPPSYEDGIWEPRIHSVVDGSYLASGREISRTLLPDINRPHYKYNLLLMQFGQFIAHDVTRSSSFTYDNGEPVKCCSEDGSKFLPPHLSHYGCMAIPIESNDEFYKQFNQGCINFVRLSLVPNQACRVGYGKQLSKVTHYLDGSVIYGSDEKSANALRTFKGGRLIMSKEYMKDLLPLTKDREQCASVQGNVCFQSGDSRTNQIISLTVVHVIFAREHNRIALILSAMNPHYNDEKLYQESRRIVTAQFQHIVYNEYLPLIIGSIGMKKFGLYPTNKKYSNMYNPEINPAITNAFTGAAFRFGHSTVDGTFKIRKNNYVESVEIPDVMFNTTNLLKRDYYDDMLRTLIEQPMQTFDSAVTHGLTRYMFRGKKTFGIDLAALNIQRGRDQGLRTYNDYLEAAGFHRIQNFNEFHPDIARKLSFVYKHPDDIDLWIGGLIEPSIGDALVGPTFVEIIGDQFSKFRRGDRYFYDNDPKINPGHFRSDQLKDIQRVSIAGIICDNLDYFTTNEVPPFAFLRADLPGNSPIRCDSNLIPRINLNLWRE